ncbi:MAG: hypothetical protein PF541_10085 [Prolixibacteraceae bacterium]|jgi:hypothetical protein|nr:hypothetical protein [Prolixibacteraceae bacterium]
MLLFATSLVFIGCQDELAQLKEQELSLSQNNEILVDSTLGFTVKVHDNTLCFDKGEDALKAMEVLNEMPKVERRAWEKSLNFQSVKTRMEDVRKQLNETESAEAYNQILKENEDIFFTTSSDFFPIINRVYENYQYITGQTGLYVSENAWCKAYDGKFKTASIYDGVGYEKLLSNSSDLEGVNLKTFILDYNWEKKFLKSRVKQKWKSSTCLCMEMYNRDINNNPDKRAKFKVELINNYEVIANSTETVYAKVYYFKIYYHGDCCTPSSYYFYYAGKKYKFEREGSGWIIELPYEGYLDSHPWSTTPNWDTSRDQYTYRYKYLYSISDYENEVKCKSEIKAEKRSWGKWRSFSNTVVAYDNISVSVKVGRLAPIEPLPFEANPSMREGPDYEYAIYVYTDDLLDYKSKPSAYFVGCISGTLKARFYPGINYNFSVDY